VRVLANSPEARSQAVTLESDGVRLALASLATWRLSHLLAEEDGPGEIVVRVRARLGSGALGSLMDCFYCLSIWIAAPFALALAPRRRQLPGLWLAISGAACLLERVTAGREIVEPDNHEEEADVLWAEAQGSEV
jgi:hypothetical protein